MRRIRKVDGVWVCAACGSPSRDQAAPHRGLCQCEPVGQQAARPRGLGDIVKDGLSAIGITEERVSKLIGRPCGCGKRREALNRLGEKLGIGGKDT